MGCRFRWGRTTPRNWATGVVYLPSFSQNQTSLYLDPHLEKSSYSQSSPLPAASTNFGQSKSDRVPPRLTNTGSPLSQVSVWAAPTPSPQVSLPAIASWKPASILQVPHHLPGAAVFYLFPRGCEFPLVSACCIRGA